MENNHKLWTFLFPTSILTPLRRFRTSRYALRLLKTFKQFGGESSSDGSRIKNNSVIVTVPRIKLAGEPMPLLPILLEENLYPDEWRQTFNGLIGYDLLKRFR